MMTDEEWSEIDRRYRTHWTRRVPNYMDERNALLEVQSWLCAICGKPMTRTKDPFLRATADHCIPLARGGPDRLGNLVAAHWQCNHAKGDRRPTGCELVWLLAVNNRLNVQPIKW
jgi:5-methylcytosine-specific restriction endonuclease McrA